MGNKGADVRGVERRERGWTAQGSKENWGSALFHHLILSRSCAVNVLLYLCQWYVKTTR